MCMGRTANGRGDDIAYIHCRLGCPFPTVGRQPAALDGPVLDGVKAAEAMRDQPVMAIIRPRICKYSVQAVGL